MNINQKSKTYYFLRWIYQPIKTAQNLYQELKYVPRRKAKLIECKNTQGFSGLHIGCGSFYMPGWINTNILGTPSIDFPLDISTELPLPDNFFDAIYGSEMIEHIELAETRLFIREALRILKPGGVIKLTTPDLTEICRIFLGLRDELSVDICVHFDFREAETHYRSVSLDSASNKMSYPIEYLASTLDKIEALTE